MDNVINFKPKQTTIEVELVDKRFSTRWMCTVCGDCTAKGSIVAEGRQDLSSGDYHVGEHRIIRVCEYCLNAGDIDARLELGARQLEAQAQLLRDLIGRLQVPTFAEWQACCEQHEREWVASDERATAERITVLENGDEIPF